MRQRNVKNLQERIASNSTFLIREPKEAKGRWKEIFGNDNPVCLEIGSGKGQFIILRAGSEPGVNYIACEGQENVGLRILEKAESSGLKNVRVFMEYIHDIGEYFEEGELSGIYLNFSDPWPKERHAKRRLTHRNNLAGFMKILKPGGAIEFKTDNEELYDFTLDEIRESRFDVIEETRDLHGDACNFRSRDFMTEYEEKFLAGGKNINYVKFTGRPEEDRR